MLAKIRRFFVVVYATDESPGFSNGLSVGVPAPISFLADQSLALKPKQTAEIGYHNSVPAPIASLIR